MVKMSKRQQAVYKGWDSLLSYDLEKAVQLLKERSRVKFDETVEICMKLGVDPRHADQMVRGMVTLPRGTGKVVRVAVFASGQKADEAKEAGADIVGTQDLAEQIEKKVMNFDRCIATPDMMGIVGKLGKILGPQGLMPNPKMGTVTMDVAEAVKRAKAGTIPFRVEKAGLLHAGIGKVSFSTDALLENIYAFVVAIQQAKPSGAKGTYIRTVHLSSTMGPGIKIDLTKLKSTMSRLQ